MRNPLKNHPFAVEAHFEHSVVLTFALPKEDLQPMIPECLELDTFQDTWAFIAVALVKTTQLRPKGFPRFLGNDFFLIGYRIFVRYHTQAGKRLRGLYILKSETDSKKMELLGNFFTSYRYSTTDIALSATPEHTFIQSALSQLEVILQRNAEHVSLPSGSPFSDWKEARRFAGPLPFTFSYDPATRRVTIIEGVRQNWTPEPVQVHSHHIGFLSQPPFSSAILASAFEVCNVPYYWKKGRTEPWR
jgi:hypothetical protein